MHLKNYLNKKKFCTKTVTTDVLIVGGGTIGMTLASLLTKYKVNYLIVEKESSYTKIMDHPKAHYISPKTVEVFNYVGAFQKFNLLKNLDYWRHYRYCEYLLDKNSYLGEIDHFNANEEEELNKIREISDSFPLHIGQNTLNKILYNKLNKQTFILDSEFITLEKNSLQSQGNHQQNLDSYLYTCTVKNSEGIFSQIKSKFVVGCEGAHSKIRKIISAENKGHHNIQTFVNAHFSSKILADHLKNINKQSMLHFIFNPKYVCVLISYDMDQGEFVMQIPYFPQVEKENDFTSQECEKIIKSLLSHDNFKSQQIDIVRIK